MTAPGARVDAPSMLHVWELNDAGEGGCPSATGRRCRMQEMPLGRGGGMLLSARAALLDLEALF